MKVRNNSGQILYHTIDYINGVKVYDSKNRLIGFCENGITRKANGNVVAYCESPGLLVGIQNK